MSNFPQFDAESDWQSAPCGLLIANDQGVITKANLTSSAWLGYSPVELEGIKKFSELLPMGARMFHQTHWSPLLQIQGSISEVQLDMLHKDGARIPMILNAMRRLCGASFRDEVAMFIATDRKKYEGELMRARERAEAAEVQLLLLNEELGRQDRMKDRFLATLAHELRNPLAPLVNGLQILKMRPNDPILWAKSHAIFERQVGQLGHLIDDLLEISRITEGKLELRKVDLDLHSLLESTVESILPSAKSAQLDLSFVSRAEGIRVFADPTRLTQIVANLLNNAVKFTPVHGAIILRAKSNEDFAVIDVIDNGVGIPKEEFERIFEMFAQVHSSQGNRHGGLGIGLSLVKGLTELHGGEINVQSDGVDKGSKFTVTIPLSLSSVHPILLGTQPIQQVEPRRILVVDDSVDSTETLAMALELMGHQVKSATNGAQALRLANEYLPDCVLLDIGLPDLSGHEVAKRLRASKAGDNLILIAVTGWGQEAEKQAAKEAGFNAHVTKPLDFSKLNALVMELFGTKVEVYPINIRPK